MTEVIEPMLQRIFLGVVLLSTLALQACAGYVELDLTFFTEMDIENEVTLDKTAEAQDTGSVAFLHRIDVDLSERGDDFPGEIGEIDLQEVAWRVPDNTMTTDLRDVSLLVAPYTSLSPDDSGTVPLGSIPHVPAMTQVETTPLVPLAAGEEALKQHLAQMQFSIFVIGYIEVEDPDSLPEGASTIEIDLRGEVHRR